jgi:hypothetical protein
MDYQIRITSNADWFSVDLPVAGGNWRPGTFTMADNGAPVESVSVTRNRVEVHKRANDTTPVDIGLILDGLGQSIWLRSGHGDNGAVEVVTPGAGNNDFLNDQTTDHRFNYESREVQLT